MALAIPVPEKLLSFLMEKVVPVLQSETKKLQSVPELLDDIKNEMEIAKDYLKKVEIKVDRTDDQTKDQLKQVNKLRALVFKIEDIIDDYMMLEQSQLGNQHEDNQGCMVGIWELINQGSKEVEGFKEKRGIACSIVRIKNAMEKIKGTERDYEGSIFTLKEEQGVYHDPSYCPLYKDEEDFVGFKERQCLVVEKLDLENKKHGKGQFVLAVWGQPGLGKTTLVQKVYEDETVRKNFTCYAWITATKPYNSVDLLKCLFKQFINSSASAVKDDFADHISAEDVQELQDNEVIIADRLRSYLKQNHTQNRYLVVLDNVSEMEELSRIIKATLVPSYSEGGRILMTTKSEHIANYWKTSSSNGEAYNLQVLSEEESKVLFNKKAFGNQGKCPQKLKSLRDTIVKECDGLPFLIEKVGATFSTTRKWIELYHDFQINPVSTSWSREVLLFGGYHEMPYHLKPCFLYLCMFPKGYAFKRMRIVRLWIAEGFVEAKDHSTREEAAEEYLNDLVERGMVHLLKSDETGRNRTLVLPCMWQHVMLPKLAALSFCQVLPQNRLSTNNQCRRLSIHKDTPNTVITPNVRSILSFIHPETFPISWSSPFKEAEFRLKVLDLQGAEFVDVPDVIGKLHNLRYLCMRNTKVKKLPESIRGLWNLQTLDLKKTDVVELPKGISRLHKLRHLLVCHYDKANRIVPVKIQNVVLQNFKELQKLAFVDGSTADLVSGLNRLTRLRRLAIENLRVEHGKTLCEALKSMEQLRSLSVSSNSIDDTEELDLRHIVSPPEFLERVYLKGPLVGNVMPKWIHKLKHLVRLRLINSGFANDPLEKLKVMQELLVLELDDAYDGEVLDFGYKGLKKLQVLRIINLSNLKTIKAGENALPRLHVAEYRTCVKLVDVPTQIEQKAREKLGNSTKSSKF